MLNKDEIKGKARQVLGTIKENLGWLTDDHKAEDEGKAERIEGKVQECNAKVMRKAEEAEDEGKAERIEGKVQECDANVIRKAEEAEDELAKRVAVGK